MEEKVDQNSWLCTEMGTKS